MEELAKQVSKMGEILNKVLENQEYMRNDISKMQEDISVMKQDISGAQEDICSLKQGQEELKKEMRDGFAKVNARIDKFEKETKENFDKMQVRMDDGFWTVQTLFKEYNDGSRGFEKIKYD